MRQAPRKVVSFFRNLPAAFVTAVKDPKQRKKWFLRGCYAFGGVIFILLFIFLITWLGAFGPIPDSNELREINQPEASKVYSHDGQLRGSSIRKTETPSRSKTFLRYS